MSSDRSRAPRSQSRLRTDARISLRTDNPLALVSAARLALRRAGTDRGEIERFTRDALSSTDPRQACGRWVRIDPSSD